jgi:Tn3 transposase DDE domain-containing protein
MPNAHLGRTSALSLVLNANIAFNTRYLPAGAAELTAVGEPVAEEAWRHVSALHWEHIHVVMTHCFDEPVIVGRIGTPGVG